MPDSNPSDKGASFYDGQTATVSSLVNISNGVCSFDPTSRRGKWVFLIQTLLLSFAPISILIVQNSMNFSEVLFQKQYVQNKTSMVSFRYMQYTITI